MENVKTFKDVIDVVITRYLKSEEFKFYINQDTSKFIEVLGVDLTFQEWTTVLNVNRLRMKADGFIY